MTGGPRQREAGAAFATAASALVGAAAFTGQPAAPIGVAAAIGGGVLVVQRPFVLALALVVLLYTRLTDFVPALAPLQPVRLVAIAALASWGLGRLFARTAIGRGSRLMTVFLLLLAHLTLAVAFSSDAAFSIDRFTNAFVKIVAAVLLLSQATGTAARLESLVFTLIGCGTFLAGFAAVQSATGQATIEGSRAGAVGLLGDPNDLALVILSTLGPSLELALAGRGWRRAAGVVATVVGVAGLAATQSRGGILGLGALLAVTFEPRIRSRAVLAAVVAGAVAVLGAGAAVGSRKTVSEGDGGIDESSRGRLDAWGAAVGMATAHPLFGVGYELAARNFERYAKNPVFWGEHETHNSYLKALGETGVPGAALFATLVGTTFVTARRLRRRAPTASPAVLGLAGSVAGFAVSAFFLSQCWGWFAYILAATVDAAARLSEADRLARAEDVSI